MKVVANLLLSQKDDSRLPISLTFIHDEDDSIDENTFISYAQMLAKANVASYSDSRYENRGASQPGFASHFRKKADYEAVLLQCFHNLPSFAELDAQLKEKVACFESSVGLITEDRREKFYARRYVTPMWAFSDKMTDTRPSTVSCEFTGVTINADYFNAHTQESRLSR